MFRVKYFLGEVMTFLFAVALLIPFLFCEEWLSEDFFQGDYDQIGNVEDELQSLVHQFTSQANESAKSVMHSFDNKKKMYENVVMKEEVYNGWKEELENSISTYNTNREDEENKFHDLQEAINDYQKSINEYNQTYREYHEEVTFLNYELYIVHEIRELLGSKIGYHPEQSVISILPYNPNYEDFTTEYTEMKYSTYDEENNLFILEEENSNNEREGQHNVESVGGRNSENMFRSGQYGRKKREKVQKIEDDEKRRNQRQVNIGKRRRKRGKNLGRRKRNYRA